MKIPYQDRLGLPGILGLGLLLFCLSFYLGTIAPARTELQQLTSEERQLTAGAAAEAGGKNGTGTAVGTASARPLPVATEIPELLKNLNAAAEKHGVTVERASYSSTDKDGRRRLEVSLPLQASYPSLRAYLRDALALTPLTSLDELHLRRAQSTTPVVEASVRLSYYFVIAP